MLSILASVSIAVLAQAFAHQRLSLLRLNRLRQIPVSILRLSYLRVVTTSIVLYLGGSERKNVEKKSYICTTMTLKPENYV